LRDRLAHLLGAPAPVPSRRAQLALVGRKEVEIVVLRDQLHVLKRQVGRAQLRDDDRVLLAALGALLPGSRRSLLLVRPETVLRWHRKLVARRWTYRERGCGRPPIDGGVKS
jgi:putative transposase